MDLKICYTFWNNENKNRNGEFIMKTEKTYNIDFKNLNKGQEMHFIGFLYKEDEEKEKVQYVKNYYEDDRKFQEAIVITDEIIIAKSRCTFNDEHEFIYEAFVNDHRVLETASYSLEGAILLGIASKFGDANAAKYMAKAAGFEL